ncbi:MAG: hypothetical protein HYV96_00350 [Opitutae bacterium]|nr:hypothetical protein [Opitutae bacterium]
MPKPTSYDPVLSSKASSFLIGLSRSKQRQVLRLLFQLSEFPSQLGDYSTRETDGREIQHLMVGDWHISFWADHAVRELRITELDEV